MKYAIQTDASIPADTFVWKPVAAALLAVLVGIGLSRFAFSPLIPAVIDAGWFSPADAAWLGAANLAGYLIGAVGGRLGGRLGGSPPRKAGTGRRRAAFLRSPSASIRVLMVLASATFVAGAFPLSFGWFFFWRLLSGICGGALMILAAPTVLPLIPPRRRGLAGGVIFAGVGLGIILSGTLVPALLTHGLPTTWLALAALSFAATALAWRWWPGNTLAEAGDTPASGSAPHAGGESLYSPALVAVYVGYGLIAIGLVPHMIFLVDFIARGLGLGIGTGGRYWIIFGVGALIGPLAAGRFADRFGVDRTLCAALVLHIACTALLAFDHSVVSLAVSSFVVGTAVSGTVALVLGQTQERAVTPEAKKGAWGIATATFALGQAAGGYACSWIFAATDGNFELLFLSGAGALFLALIAFVFVATNQPGRLPRC